MERLFIDLKWALLLSSLAGSLGSCALAAAPGPPGWSGREERFRSLAEHEALAPPRRGAAPLPEEELLILVMASRALEHRATLAEEAWGRRRVQYYFLVDDWLESVPRARQWRSASGDRGGPAAAGSSAVDASYWDAQTRQLEYMRKHARLGDGHQGVKWVFLADDDTWVHIDRLCAFLGAYDPVAPVLFTYVLSDAHVLGYDYPCGGAGMLLSATAYDELAPRLLTPSCPLLSFNDLTLGFCAHSRGIPLVHHPDMHCSPDVNRAMRPGENLLDLQPALSVHRVPAFPNYLDLIASLDLMHGQLPALLQHGCRLAARALSGDAGLVLDSRRFFWAAEALPGVVAACRANAPAAPRGGALHLDFVLFGSGVPVARYHKDRHTPLVAEPGDRRARWPEWLEQLRGLDCAHGGDTWSAQWLDSSPRLSRRQVDASDLEALAAGAGVGAPDVGASFAALERQSPRGSWLHELRRAARTAAAERGVAAAAGERRPGPGRRWLFLSLAATTTFVNAFECLRLLRSLSDLWRAGRGPGRYAADARGPVELGADEPPPLALAYEYADYNVEPDAGVWLNGPAVERVQRCPPLRHPIVLDPGAHANDWETPEERLALMWHNALGVDVFRTLRFCGVLLLHAPRMVPHALSYLPYSTYRRPHAPSVDAALTIGNVAAREQMYAMAQLVRRRACQARREARRDDLHGGGWRLPLRMRVVGGGSPLNFTSQNWMLPGARFLGMSLLAFRSEHFLPDAQAA